MKQPSQVLVSWVAVNNDPYERHSKTGDYIRTGDQVTPGPTITLLFDPDSPYLNKIKDVVFLRREVETEDGKREARSVKETSYELMRLAPDLRIHFESWSGADPTDHHGIYEFLRQVLPKLRRRFAGCELLFHISPGTPSMQTIWVLMAETGFVDPPFRLVKSLRRNERHGRPPVLPVEVGLETFYKAYRASHPSQVASSEHELPLNPGRFQTDRMRKLLEEARRFAQVKVPVLILGERGTGKSTLAGWIRLHSPYRKKELDGNWPAIACGQYNPETMRSELFGYKRGAFTGANSDREGLISAAHGDTLFLDEIGDVTRDLQRLLIKAVEEKRFHPLGDDEPRLSDFRLISATNLEEAELALRLDPDFRDRINTLTLRMPALREIRDDLGWLWESAYQEAASRAGAGRRQAQLADAHHQHVVACLRLHPLPGNMRDLLRVAYRIIAARCDVHAPLTSADAVDYGLEALTHGGGASTGNTSQAIARAFAEKLPLDAIIADTGKVSSRALERDLHHYLAQEIRRIAKAKNLDIGTLCDVTERSLREWARSGRNDPYAGKTVPDSTGRDLANWENETS